VGEGLGGDGVSSLVNVPTEKLIELCNDFFKKENTRVAKESVTYREGLLTKRRLFGLLKPKYTKEELDKWDTPTIYDSMAFQTMFPHYKIAELMLSADLAKVSGIENVLVETKVFHYLDRSKGSGW